MSPFIPHICEELWRELGNGQSIFLEKWPAFDPQLMVESEIELVVQINGKVRAKLLVNPEISEIEATKLALADVKVKQFLAGNNPRKIIFVKGKLLNFVV